MAPHDDECPCDDCRQTSIIKDESRMRPKTEMHAENLLNSLINDATRVEVIEDIGRVVVQSNCKITASLQDEGKTLKIFVERREEK